jgi:hypothetical protein
MVIYGGDPDENIYWAISSEGQAKALRALDRDMLAVCYSENISTLSSLSPTLAYDPVRNMIYRLYDLHRIGDLYRRVVAIL